MISIGVVSQKGGAGKTTLAIHLAVLAQQSGRRTALIDCDPQQSAAGWYRLRSVEDLALVTAGARDLPRLLKEARDYGFDVVLADTAPHANAEATYVAKAVDFALVPCRPAILDMQAMTATVDLVRTLGKPAAIILNAVPPRRTVAEAGVTTEARAALKQHALPIVPTAVVQRCSLQHALNGGWAVTEYEPDGKAAQELREVWSWLTETIQ